MNDHRPGVRLVRASGNRTRLMACSNILYFKRVRGVTVESMNASEPEIYRSEFHHDSFPKDAIFIIGAGHFGKRAASILSQKSDSFLTILDIDEQRLLEISGITFKKIKGDGIDFLVGNFHILSPSNIIIPAIPVHLASEWLKKYLDNGFELKQIQVPKEIKTFLPHTWPGTEGSLLVSYADFQCPDDCPEPRDHCTVTKEKRKTPLYNLLGQLKLLEFKVHIIRSCQLAPGLGGFRVDDLNRLATEVRDEGIGRWLVGTACKCHGTVTALERV